MCKPPEKNLPHDNKDTTCATSTKQNHNHSTIMSIVSSLFFVAVMSIATISIFCAMLQLEKLYYVYDNEDETIGNKQLPLLKLIGKFIPILSTLTFHESMALCTTSVLILAFYIQYQLRLLTKAKLNMPTVTTATQLPFLGTALAFLTNTPWDLMESWHRSYGPIYSFTLLGRSMVSIEHPDHLKEVLQSKIQNVKKDVDFAYKPFLPILGKGIVTSEGKGWMNQRRKISALLKVDILEKFPKATLAAVQRLMIKLDQCAKDADDDNDNDNENDNNGQEKATIDIAEELRHLTLQVISGTFMSLDAEESDTTFATMYLPIVEEGNKRVWRPERSFMFFMPTFWKYIFGVRRLNRYVSDLIMKRWELRKQEKNICNENEMRDQDILDKVLNHFEKGNPGQCLSSNDVRQLRDEFKTFMLAGHETSAAMMTWTFYELMKDGDLMKQVCLLVVYYLIVIFS